MCFYLDKGGLGQQKMVEVWRKCTKIFGESFRDITFLCHPACHNSAEKVTIQKSDWKISSLMICFILASRAVTLYQNNCAFILTMLPLRHILKEYVTTDFSAPAGCVSPDQVDGT